MCTSMFTSTLNSTWEERSRRGLTTLSSFGVQALIAGVLLVLPLLRPAGLPSLRPLSTPVSLGQPLGEAPAVRARDEWKRRRPKQSRGHYPDNVYTNSEQHRRCQR